MTETDTDVPFELPDPESIPGEEASFVSNRMRAYGIAVTSDEILMTHGAQHALDLILRLCTRRGDRVVVEAPTYAMAHDLLRLHGLEPIEVPMMDGGMNLEYLKKILDRRKPRLVYTMPNFQNPTGVTISLERRKKILELADHYGVPVVEDDPYGKLRYQGEHIPPMIALDAQKRPDCADEYCGNVLYMSTFSKTLAPGLRVAWTIAPKEVILKMVQAKQGADLHSPTFNQFISYEATRDGFIETYVEKIKAIYGERRQVMLAAIEEYFPPTVEWTKPEGGMFVWVTLPEGIHAGDLLLKAVERKVAFVPGGPFHPNGGGENTMRLNFSNSSPDLIQKGIALLGQTIQEALAEIS